MNLRPNDKAFVIVIAFVIAVVNLAVIGAAPADDFPQPTNSEPDTTTPLLAPDEAAAAIEVPAGFRVNVFAAEPDVQNPIAIAWDTRGRMWVAENYTYSDRTQRFDLSLRDRLLIFTDTDGDGRADKRQVFTDQLQMLTSVELGWGGVWLMCPPRLLFIPDRDGDDVPDGPAEVVLDGFTVARDNYHNFANGLRWGPDGWLYGRSGHSCPGWLGAPGTPDDRRVPIRGGIWRYHPQRRVVEVLAHGTTNPWGHDWDRDGELFFINTVNGHLWHTIPGAHLTEYAGASLNPYVYQRLDTIADHYHYDTTVGQRRNLYDPSGELGGGHAHIGMMIYQADQWPAEYRDKLFTLNMHGRRTNVERLERHASGYVGRHDRDVFISSDPWFRGVEISVGPDGSAYLVDWADLGECHEHTGVHRTSGRIFRVSYSSSGEPVPGPSPADVARHGGPLGSFARADGPRSFGPWCLRTGGKLADLWLRYQAGEVDRAELLELTRDSDEHLRVWGVRLLTDHWPLDTIIGPPAGAEYPDEPETWEALMRLARDDSSGLVHLMLSSTLARSSLERRAALADALVRHEQYAGDAYLPAMVWYGLIPLGQSDPMQLVDVARHCRWPDTTRRIARFLAGQIEQRPEPLNRLLETTVHLPAELQLAVLGGMREAFLGWRSAPRLPSWPALASVARQGGPEMATLARELELLFGDGRALEELKAIVADRRAELAAREAALRTLIDARPPDLRNICESVLTVRGLNSVAVRGLALFDDPEIGRRLAADYLKFHADDRPAVLDTLVSRPEFARALLDQVGPPSGRIPAGDISAFLARRIQSHGDAALSAKLAEVWGLLGESTAERQANFKRWKQTLTSDVLAKADLARGAVLFRKTCGNCHRLHGEGGRLGPDLTGSQRGNLDYLLENIVDPSAVVTAEFRTVVVTTRDGRVLNGVVTARDDRTMTLSTPTEDHVIRVDDIDEQTMTSVSTMPDDLLHQMSEAEVRDLIAFLMGPGREAG